MTAWLVRAGRNGEREDLALDAGLAVVGWKDLPSLEDVTDRPSLVGLIRATYPQAGERRVANWASQLWAFRERMRVGDLVVLPSKRDPVLAIGRVAGPYEHRAHLPPDARHARPVRWLCTDIARAAVGQDLLYSLGAFLTVCEIKRNEAAARIEALAVTGVDPGRFPGALRCT